MSTTDTSQVESLLRSALTTRPHPAFPGAVAQIAVRGQVLPPVVVGDAVRWADPRHELDDELCTPMTADTIFDIASITKVFTAVVALRTLSRHGIHLDDPVCRVLGEYAEAPKGAVTWRHLLTHTSGLPAACDVWQRHLTEDERRANLLATPLQSQPGVRQTYSCVGYITAGIGLERLTGTRLDRLVEQEVTRPLGLADTCYRPRPALRSRTAATEWADHAGRGMVRGEVHDETSWSLGGITGNAGLFATAGDLLRLGLALSQPKEAGLLDAEQWRRATTDQRPAGAQGEYGQAIGLRVGDPGLMPGLGHWCGHTGFTGTSLILEPGSDTVGVLLANRVHPRREWSDLRGLRQEFTRIVHDLTRPQ